MRVHHPRPALGRQKFIGVEFRDGIADLPEPVHPELELALLQHGFTIEKDLVVPEPEEPPFEPLPTADNREKESVPRRSRRRGRPLRDGENRPAWIVPLNPDEE